MKHLLWVGAIILSLLGASACQMDECSEPLVSDSDSIYHLHEILKIAFEQPELAIRFMDSCEAKQINSVDSIRFYRGTLYGLLEKRDTMFMEWEKILFRDDADKGSDLYLHVLKSEASMKNNRNEKVTAIEYCLLGDSLASALGKSYWSIQFRVLAANIGNERFVQKENIEILEKCLEESKPFLESKRKYNIYIFIRNDLYEAYSKYNLYADEEKYKKDDAFLYEYVCESKRLLDQIVEKHYGGVSNESLDYKFIDYYGLMIEHLCKMGRIAEARSIYENKAKPLCLAASRIMRTGNNMALMQASLGDFKEAVSYFLSDLEKNEAVCDSNAIRIDLKMLVSCYERMGDFASAFQMQTRYLKICRLMARRDLLDQSAEYLTLFKVQEHAMAKREAEVESEFSRMVALSTCGVSAMLVFLLLLLLVNYYTIKKKNHALVANINELLDVRKKEDEVRAREVRKMQEMNTTLADSAPDAVDKVVDEAEENEQVVQRFLYEMTSRKLFCDSDWNRDSLLHELHIKKTSFPRVFESVTGCPFARYLLNVRLEYAAEQIRLHPDYTIETIATGCGLASRSTFYRNFMDRFGITPTLYRSQCDNR